MAAIQAHRRAISISSIYDTDTLAYMSATGIPNTSAAYYGTPYTTTGAAMWASADTFIRGLKNAGLWARIQVLYPLLGGTAGSHAVNAKTPGTYNLIYRNTPTHAAQGIRFTPAATQLANTGYLANQLPGTGGAGVDYYSADATGSSTAMVEMGGAWGADGIFLCARNISVANKALGRAASGGDYPFANAASPNTLGLFTIDRTAAAVGRIYRNGGVISNDFAMDLMPTRPAPIVLGALNQVSDPVTNGAYGYTDRGCSLACVRGSFTAAEMTTYYNLVQAFQTANFRNV